MAQKIQCPTGHVYESDATRIDALIENGVLVIDAKCPVCGLPFAAVNT